MKFRPRVWKSGDTINTDLILPIQAFYLPAAEQPPVEGPGLLVGLDTELATQHLQADLVLAQGRRVAARVGVQAHQQSVRALVQRIEGEEPLGPVEGGGVGRCCDSITNPPEGQAPRRNAWFVGTAG